MEAKLYKSTGEILDIEPKNGKNFTLKELYELIGCELVEIVHLSNSYMIVDEEGKLKEPCIYNHNATEIFHNKYPTNDFIAGHAVICPKKMFK